MSRFVAFDKDISGSIYHLNHLIFEDGKLKIFKGSNIATAGQKVIGIGRIDDWYCCLNVTKELSEIVKKLKLTNQLFELNIRQTKEIYRDPKPNTYIRLDHVHVFKEMYGGFEKISFFDKLYDSFEKVSNLALFNPMNIKNKDDIFLLPGVILNNFCRESQIAFERKYEIRYEELKNRTK